jgi:hypothetical protein
MYDAPDQHLRLHALAFYTPHVLTAAFGIELVHCCTFSDRCCTFERPVVSIALPKNPNKGARLTAQMARQIGSVHGR